MLIFLFIVTSIVGVCNCSMFCCTLLYVHSSIAIILMGKRELVALLNLSSWCLVMVEQLFHAVPRGCLRFVIVVFPDHTHLLFSFFFHLDASGSKFDLYVKKTKVYKGQSLSKLGGPHIPNVTYQFLMLLVIWFQRRRYSKGY